MENIFDIGVAGKVVGRLNTLNPHSKPVWGRMSVAQMLAHCNVAYEMVFEDKHQKPNALMKIILKAFVKNLVTNEMPYKHNSKTGPQFIVSDDKDFEAEKQRLIANINKTAELGEQHFDGKESHSLGKLSKAEWSNMFYKHLDHHLRQFGV